MLDVLMSVTVTAMAEKSLPRPVSPLTIPDKREAETR